MGLLSAIGRAAPLVAAGMAAGWYLRRQGLLGGRPQSALPSPPQPEPVIESTAEEAPAPEPDPGEYEPELEHHLDAVAAVSDAADVTAVVEDLLAAAPGEITDAEVVEDEAHPDDPEIAAAVRLALAGEPGLLSGSVEIDVVGGTAWLRGELTRPADIERAGRRAGSVRGVSGVRNELQLPGASSAEGPPTP